MTEAAIAETPVLVVGAGPVGLLMASELRRHGVECRVVDGNDGPTPLNESRALGIQARTMEVFRDAGVAGTILEQARKMYGLSAYSEGKKVVHVGFDFAGLDTEYPFVLAFPQSRTERVLLDHLGRLGGAVERGTKLASLAQDGSGVTASMEGKDEAKAEIRAGWVVGCDGSRSVVRKALGLAFEGGEYEERFLIADLIVRDWPAARDEISMYLTPDGPLIVFPLLEDDLFRLVDTTGMVPGEDPNSIVARFSDLIHAHACAGARVGAARWTSAFHLHRRVVDDYRQGRCFVAGDAAHLYSPAGGQGMNTGLQDAYNLAWKLALVVKGRSPEALLDSYSAERRPVARGVLRGSDNLTKAVTFRDPIARHLRDKLLSVLGEFDFVGRAAARNISELDLNYRDSPIVGEDHEGFLASIAHGHVRDRLRWLDALRAGDRVPDVLLDHGDGDGDGPPRRLGEFLSGGRHVLLLFDGPDPSASSRIEAASASARSLAGDLVRVVRVTREPSTGPDVLADPSGDLHRRFGAPEGDCLYLVRPDGYVGSRSRPIDAETLGRSLARLFLPAR